MTHFVYQPHGSTVRHPTNDEFSDGTTLWVVHTCGVLNERPGEHALSAVEPAVAPIGINMLDEEDVVALLKRQIIG